jgi:hypothetical protein
LVGRVHADYVVARADEGIEEEKVCGDSAGGDDWETLISVLRDRREKTAHWDAWSTREKYFKGQGRKVLGAQLSLRMFSVGRGEETRAEYSDARRSRRA